MKKLALNLDSLVVESFETSIVGTAGGTVEGQQWTNIWTCVTCPNQGTCPVPSCGGSCVEPTCPYSCYATCTCPGGGTHHEACPVPDTGGPYESDNGQCPWLTNGFGTEIG